MLKDAFCIVLIISALNVFSYSADLKGQLGLQAEISEDIFLKAYYFPEIEGDIFNENGRKLDYDISLKASVYRSDADLGAYRSWLRYSSDRLELRIGRQKLSFGAATFLRPLMWFENYDIKDPFALAKGVDAVLIRYYGLNNSKLWLWGLYGNTALKGHEKYKTKPDSLESGGRYSFSIMTAELGLSCSFRSIDRTDYLLKKSRYPYGDLEKKFGFDVNMDVGPGIWAEYSSSGIEESKNRNLWVSALCIGSDYTFDIGPGLHLSMELFGYDESVRGFVEDLLYPSLAAVSADMNLSLLDNIRGIVYYSDINDNYSWFLSFIRAYDMLTLNISGFSGFENSSLLDKGLLIALSYNH